MRTALLQKFHFSILILGTAHLLSAAVLELNTREGLERLARTAYRTDFAKLSTFFRAQTDLISCGPTSGMIVLNALRWTNDKTKLPLVFKGKEEKDLPKITLKEDYFKTVRNEKEEQMDPQIFGYTPETFFNEDSLKVKPLEDLYGKSYVKNLKTNVVSRQLGYELKQLAELLEKGHHLQVTKTNVGAMETEGKEFTAQEKLTYLGPIKENLKTPNNYVLVNYLRGKIPGQKGLGHISPLAAYDPDTESMLILDVNPLRGGWIWVSVDELLQAMNTFDTTENRGYLLVSESEH